MPATTPSLKVTKTFTYRGTSKTWSNRYHFNGGTPADAAHWTTLSDAITTAEKAIYPSGFGISIVGTWGYAAGSEIPVFSKTYAVAATGSFVSTVLEAGDTAIMHRYATTARTSKNHPVYLYNYFHGVSAPASGPFDNVLGVQLTAHQAYAAAWIAGFSDGTHTCVRAGPNGATATGYLISPYIRHRDFS